MQAVLAVLAESLGSTERFRTSARAGAVLTVFRLPELVAAARADDRAVLDEFDAVCREAGGFAIADAPLPPGLLERVHRDTLALFSLPATVKAGLRSRDGDQFVGWKGQEENRNEYGFPDHKEMFHIGPRVDPTLKGPDRSGTLPAALSLELERSCELWPEQLPEVAASWHAYYRAMQELASLLGEVMAAALRIPLQDWRDLIADNWSDLAANFYPPPGADTAAQVGAGVRNAVHSDLTLFTVLFQDSGGGGGLHMQARGGEWLDVPPTPGEFLVNIGELLTYLTSGRWWAVPHEVKPADLASVGADTVRISIPFFHRPNDGQQITPFARFSTDVDSPLQVGEWVRNRKLQAAGA
jgi:isopenicillin N synthase-like dioxygenase